MAVHWIHGFYLDFCHAVWVLWYSLGFAMQLLVWQWYSTVRNVGLRNQLSCRLVSSLDASVMQLQLQLLWKDFLMKLFIKCGLPMLNYCWDTLCLFHIPWRVILPITTKSTPGIWFHIPMRPLIWPKSKYYQFSWFLFRCFQCLPWEQGHKL